MGLIPAMFLLFLTLKLTNFIDWSWWWVTSPLWIGAIFYVCVITALAVIKMKYD